MIFHEDPGNIQSPTLGPRLTARKHLLDPLDPVLVYTCCYKAEQNGTSDTHDCDRNHIYYVRQVVTQRYCEYMKSGANEVRSTCYRAPCSQNASQLTSLRPSCLPVEPYPGFQQNSKVVDSSGHGRGGERR